MKKWKSRLAAVAAAVMLIGGYVIVSAVTAGTQADPTSKTIFTDGATKANAIDYAPKAAVGSRAATLTEETFRVLQGSCSDGNNIYVVMEKSGSGTCVIVKLDLNGNEIGRSAVLELDHGNDITYNSVTDQLVISHTLTHPDRVTLINPEDLTVIGTKDLGFNIYAIDYCRATNQYVAGLQGSYGIAIFDGDLNPVTCYPSGANSGYTSQGIYCDEQYIYLPQSIAGKDGAEDRNAIICYNWSGKYCGFFEVTGAPYEIESMFAIGDQLYVGYYVRDSSQSYLFTVTLDKSQLAQ